MEDWGSFFAGKKVTLSGLGLLGRGAGDAEFLAQYCGELIVTDMKTEAELAPSLERLGQFQNIRYTLGEHRLDDFQGRDLVIYGPKTPLDSQYIAEARKNGIHTTMSTALFARLAGIPVVGVTGTRGKTTTTMLIAHALERAGKKVFLGGNIRGVSTLAFLPQITPDSIAVLELDSWQLQGFADEQISPHIAVFTNLMPDHLDYYPDMQAYFADKANIFRFQRAGDALIVGAEVAKQWIIPARPSAAPVVPASIPTDWGLKIIGEHNREKAALAAEALRALGLSEADIKDGLESFEPAEGRLQFIREVNGVKIYNDNNATTPEATIAGLQAFPERKNIVLIMGGADKGLDASALLAEISKRCRKVVLLSGTGTEKIQNSLPGATVHGSLEAALAEATASAEAGDVILFSPAFASFGMFRNEYDRNDRFTGAVKKV